MKKTYIIPTTQMVAVQQQTIIANSPDVTLDKDAGVAPELFQAKGDRGSRATYKVWDDDWSK